MKKIGLLGLAFDSGNKGCEALGYGFLNILEQASKRNNDNYLVLIFQKCDIEKIYNIGNYQNLHIISIKEFGIRKKANRQQHIKNFKECDIVFDFTAGDSFSDIYGMKRFLQRSIIKYLAIKSKTKFVLGSQTYGPYKYYITNKIASYIIKNSYKVFARDQKSSELASKLGGQDICCTIDIAFAMQYQKLDFNREKIRIGINPSGLLWNGGYTENNQFNLKVDYKAYCKGVIDYLINSDLYEIFLIPHVISNDMSQIDNDLIACYELQNLYDKLKISPIFENPIEAKSFISSLDFFTGARMHATIAAFSTGVPVLPFAYSPKFEGLFANIGYKKIIDGKKTTTEQAIKYTISSIENREALKKEIESLSDVLEKGVEKLITETASLLM